MAMVTASSEATSVSSGIDRDNTVKFFAKQHNSSFNDKGSTPVILETLARLFSGIPQE